MGILLQVIGGIWAIVGVGNLIQMPWGRGEPPSYLVFGLMVNMLLFMLPGLVLCGIGSVIKRKNATASKIAHVSVSSSPLSVEDRLAKLVSLRDKGLISDEEHARLRQQVLNEV